MAKSGSSLVSGILLLEATVFQIFEVFNYFLQKRPCTYLQAWNYVNQSPGTIFCLLNFCEHMATIAAQASVKLFKNHTFTCKEKNTTS